MKYWLSLGFLLCSIAGSWAQTVSLTAKISEREVSVNQYFTVTYTLTNANAKRFIPPSFNDFKVISDMQRSESFSVINGRMTRSQGYSFTLMPKRTGTYRIPSAKVLTQKGEELQSETLSVKVVQKTEDKSGNADLVRRLDKGVFVRMEPSTTRAVVGEQVLLDLVIYTKETLDRIEPLEVPQFKDLYVRTIPNPGPTRNLTINGERYISRRLYRMAVFPVKAGEIEVPEVAVRVGVKIPGVERRGFFGIFEENRMLPHNVVSPKTRIEVRKPENPPAGYNGAVGQYQMTASLSDSSITTDDALRLRIQISGIGDVKQILPPPLNLPDSLFQVYEPEIEEHIEEQNEEIGGFKLFEYVLIPKASGNFTIRPSFHFYENQSDRFIKLDTSFQVQIQKGLRPLKGNTEEAQDSMVYLEPKPPLQAANWQSGSSAYFWAKPWYWILLLLPLLAIGGYHLWRYRQAQLANRDENELRQGQAAKVVRKRLQKVKALLQKGEQKPFFEALSSALWDYASDKLQIPLAELNKRNVQEKLSAAQAQPESIQAFVDVLEHCERAVFAGMQQDAQAAYQQAAEVLENLEKQIQL